MDIEDNGQPTPVEILTAEQINLLSGQQVLSLLEAGIAEDEWLRTNGTKSLETSGRFRELRTQNAALESAYKAINEPLPAPVTEIPTIVAAPPVAPVAVAPVVEVAPAVEAAPVAEVAEVVAEEVAPVIEIAPEVEGTDAAVAEATLELIAANLAPKGDGPVVLGSADGDAPVEETAAQILERNAMTAPMRAGLGNQGTVVNADGSTEVQTTNDGGINFAGLESIVASLTSGSSRNVTGDSTSYLATVDRFAGVKVPRLGNDANLNDRIMAEWAPQLEPMMACLCGRSQHIENGGTCCRADRPVAALFAGNTVPIGTGKFSWNNKWSRGDLVGTAAQTWRECDQALVDPNDSSTWKPFATLPDCDDECTAKPWMNTGGLKVNVCDEMSRPERIQDAYNLVECDMAESGERQLLKVADFYSRLRTFDAAATGLGAAAALPLALTSLMMRAGLNRRTDGQNYVAIVEEHVRDIIALDMYQAGERGSDAESRIREDFRLFGISNVIFTPDFACDGPKVDDYDDDAPVACDLDLCTFDDMCSNFAAGIPVESMPLNGSIRIFDPSDFRYGTSQIVDFALRRSPELMLQNCALWFGETAEILFKLGSCSPSFRLDLTGLCASGNRVEANGCIKCV